jgi:hypothetical protein
LEPPEFNSYRSSALCKGWTENFGKWKNMHPDPERSPAGSGGHARPYLRVTERYGYKLKLSPAPSHRGTQKGAVRGGFDREAFVRTCEQAFDRQTGYKRDQQESFDYCHAMKNGTVAAIREQARIRVEQEFHNRQEQAQLEKGIRPLNLSDLVRISA